MGAVGMLRIGGLIAVAAVVGFLWMRNGWLAADVERLTTKVQTVEGERDAARAAAAETKAAFDAFKAAHRAIEEELDGQRAAMAAKDKTIATIIKEVRNVERTKACAASPAVRAGLERLRGIESAGRPD